MIQRPTKRRRRFASQASFLCEEGGNIAPIFAILMIPIIGVLAVATEASGWYFTQGSIQNAADAAALAGAANVTAGGNTACTSTDHGNPCKEALAVTAKYGYSNGSNGVSVTPEPVVNCPDGTVNSCYRVTITRKLPVRLMAITGFRGNADGGRSQAIPAVAIAQTGGGGSSGCILALSSSAADAVELKNNAALTDSNCGVYSNSSSPSAIKVANNASIAGPTYAVGGTSLGNNAKLNGTPNKTGVAATADPYANVPYPTTAELAAMPCYTGTYSAKNNVTLPLTPGRYCNGINAKNNVTVTMTAGTYYVESEFVLNNNVTVNATPTDGVTIIIVGNYEIDFGNNIQFNITSKKTGDYAGIAFMGPRNGTTSTEHVFENNGANTFVGAIYFPSQMVSFSNNAGLSSPGCVQLIAAKIFFQNNSFISSNCTGTGVRSIGSGARYVKLVK